MTRFHNSYTRVLVMKPLNMNSLNKVNLRNDALLFLKNRLYKIAETLSDLEAVYF